MRFTSTEIRGKVQKLSASIVSDIYLFKKKIRKLLLYIIKTDRYIILDVTLKDEMHFLIEIVKHAFSPFSCESRSSFSSTMHFYNAPGQEKKHIHFKNIVQ